MIFYPDFFTLYDFQLLINDIFYLVPKPFMNLTEMTYLLYFLLHNLVFVLVILNRLPLDC